MKNVFLLMALGLLSFTTQAMPTDTTIVAGDKRIEIIEETDNRMKVKVYEITEDEGDIESDMVFEGHYRDGRSYERRHIRSIHIPIPNWSRSWRGFDAHWVGFGMGFANFADQGLKHINDIEGVSLRSGNSLEYNLNFWEKSFLFSPHSGWAIVTGAGLRWSRYRIKSDQYFKESDGKTSLHPAPTGGTDYLPIRENIASRLNITSLTIPLLLEWQDRMSRHDNFFLSAGIVAVIKTASSSKVTYKIGDKKKVEKIDSGMTLRPLALDVLLQAGYNHIGLYAKYSPMTLFESGKGPALHPVSIGLQLHF